MPTEDVKAVLRRPQDRPAPAGNLEAGVEGLDGLNETQPQYIWKQFNIHKIKSRQPPELDFPAEEPRTFSDLVSPHINDMGYSLGDLSKVLIMNETELAKYSIDLPGHEKGRAAHLRVIQ